MAYFSLHAYDADVWIREFKGLDQSDTSLSPVVRFADEVLNVETPNGVLQPHAGFGLLSGEFEGNRVETLATFYRRWYEGPGSKRWMVCAAGGVLYYRQEGDETQGWVQVPYPEDFTGPYQSNAWSWISYQHSTDLSENPVDVIIMSNDLDGMIMIIPPDRDGNWNDVREEDWDEPGEEDTWWAELKTAPWETVFVDTRSDRSDDSEPQKKFAVIERHADRIWGTGVPGKPDSLFYSAVFDPTDWRAYPYPDPSDPTTYIGEPEDGAGEVQQPSWDGDTFFALKVFGDRLVAFKRNRIWNIIGTDPGEYTFQEKFGGGTMCPNTVAVDVERILMVSATGLSVYDGMSAAPFQRDKVEDIWKTVNRDAMDQICACLFKNRYYVSIPVDGSEVNNALIIVDLNEGTFLYYKDFKIEAFLPTDDVLYATSSTMPGKIMILNYNSWDCGTASGAATKWVTPWMDFGYKRIVKGGFDLYFIPEVKDTAVTLKFSVQTEKKLKSKSYTVQPLTEEQKGLNKEHRGKRLHFSGTGRRFRLIIETAEGITDPWRLIGGIQMVVETDPD